jgi:hypothetical protein
MCNLGVLDKVVLSLGTGSAKTAFFNFFFLWVLKQLYFLGLKDHKHTQFSRLPLLPIKLCLVSLVSVVSSQTENYKKKKKVYCASGCFRVVLSHSKVFFYCFG